MPTETAAPGPVRLAGALVALQGLTALVYALFALVRGIFGLAYAGLAYGDAVAFLIIAVAFGAPGLLLLRGRRGARNAAVFVQLLVLGGVWYNFSPAEWVTLDLLISAWCVAVLVLLFLAPSRHWYAPPQEDEPPAA
ncbi:hypothetical protein GCM10010174_11760 [Kutzneria viridogrisea]|uniref:Glucose dehydrogenase n=1 Tax=Kutzneria viridogrisea TaxID=47990 RepID=A0ABR6BI98_9PSEU|nr:glucose dehydrogenase [Kutzneria viridogrisea]